MRIPVSSSCQSQAPASGERNPLFPYLVLSTWGCGLVLLGIEIVWLRFLLLVLISTTLSVSNGRSWALRFVTLLALALPIAKHIIQSPPEENTKSPANPALTREEPSPEVIATDTQVVRQLVDSEETILLLNQKLTPLSNHVLELRLPGPDAKASSLFAPTLHLTDVIDLQKAPPQQQGQSIESFPWPLGSASVQNQEKSIWQPLFDRVSFFEHADLVILEGNHPDGDRWRFESKASFTALARMKSEDWRSFDGKIDLIWERPKTSEGGAGEWQITQWHTKEMHWRSASKPFFTESLASALGDPQTSSKLRRSQHFAATVKHYTDGMQNLPHPYFAPISVNQKEGLAIVDINKDGWDDIYITVRIGKNMLLVNQGDGTFAEQSEAYQLDLPGHTTCALFADFDNDGDQDVMLGRSLLKSSYLENRDGVFHQVPIPTFMPMAVISMSAADYNNDGLLDVYLCTYRPAAPSSASPAGGVAQGEDDNFDWPDEFFDPELAREYRQRVSEHQQRKGGTVLDQLGPPNMLLINRGNGQFEPAPENETIGVWRNSLQATWGDYNLDGRPDLYIANDWGLDSLFRNDGPDGFTDVSQQVGITSYGYAMGATWGDYDNDGWEDLYVSNMYSEAGRRMTRSIPGLDPMFVESAAGNWLYHRTGAEAFQQVAGMNAPAMTVLKAGWSWGGCFVDFDNDTFLDLYVLSGYFTAPKQLDSGIEMESNLWRTMVRTDPTLARSSFRLSPEWKRTSAPDNQGPMIDARLAGVEREGNRVEVHSLNGSERNHYFANRNGQSFSDVSALSGLDNIADSRGFAVLDFDRDGWQDLALVNANEPMFNLYHNDMAASGYQGGVIAIKFVGGNKTGEPNTTFTCRDGYGARVTVDLAGSKLIREHRCGDGWSTQNTSTMLIGIGNHAIIPMLTVKWPSGKTAVTKDIPEGTLLTVYENPAEASQKGSFERSTYRIAIPRQVTPPKQRSLFPVATADSEARPGFKLRVYTTFSTANIPYVNDLARLQHLRDTLLPDGVEFVAVTVDPRDTEEMLGNYASTHQPATRLVIVPPDQRSTVLGLFAKVFGGRPPMPSSVVTDGEGRILGIQTGLPGISTLRKLLVEAN
jgi:hypothetical protein